MKTNGEQGGNGNGTATAEVKKPQTLKDYLMSKRASFADLLPRTVTIDRFMRIVLAAITKVPALAQCSQTSILMAVAQAAELGLEPNGALGQAAIIPYAGVATFQVMYRGVITLAYRSGQLKTITAHEVCEKDRFDYQYGLNANLVHIPAEGDRGKVTKYYAYYLLKDGGFDFAVMTHEDVDKHAKQYSKAYKNGGDTPWKSNFDAMAKKTVLLKVLKYAPLSVELPVDSEYEEREMRNVTPLSTERFEIEEPATDGGIELAEGEAPQA